MQCLVLLQLGPECMHVSLGMPWTVGLGDTWTTLRLALEIGVSIVVLFVQLQVRFAQFKGQSCGMMAIQAMEAVYLGMDNRKVVRHLGRICDDVALIKPFHVDG